MLALLCLILSSCGPESGRTPDPKSVYYALKEKATSEDWEGFLNLIVPNAIEQFESDWNGKELSNEELELLAERIGVSEKEALKLSGEQALLSWLKRKGATKNTIIDLMKTIEFLHVETEGDKGTLRLVIGETPYPFYLQRVNENWYVTDEFGIGQILNFE